jgi:hypothetical protein
MTKPLLEKLLSYTIYTGKMEFFADCNEMYPLDILEEKNYLLPNGTTTMISCCPDGADVVWMHIKGRGDVPFGTCVNCQIFEIDPQRLRRWNLRLETILERLAEKLELRGGVRSLFTDLLLRLGRKKGREYIYVRRYVPKERRVLRDELARMPKSVLVTCNDFMLDEIRSDHDHASFALKNVASLDDQCEMVIDFDALRDILGEDETPDKKSKPKPPPKRSPRTVKLEKLAQELERFIKDARDYAITTAKRGNMEILPPPTMDDLAKRTGMGKTSVFRCINDENAKMLRILWEKANDIQSTLF